MRILSVLSYVFSPRSRMKWGQTSAALLLACTLGLTAAPVASAKPPGTTSGKRKAEVTITETARKHFRAGVAFLQDPDGARYEEAYQQFKLAYADSPSWKILGNLGLSAMKIELDGEAIDAMTQYLEESGNDIAQPERDQVRRDIDALKAGAAQLSLSTNIDGVKITDERRTSRGDLVINEYSMPEDRYLVLRVRAGTHKITARAEGFEDAVWENSAPASSSLDITLRMEKPAPAPAVTKQETTTEPGQQAQPSNSKLGQKIGGFAALGVGAAGIGLGVFFGAKSKSDIEEADRLCGGSRDDCNLTEDDPNADDVVHLNEQASTKQTLSIVSYVVGGAAIATGATLLIVAYATGGKNTALGERALALRHRQLYEAHVDPYFSFGQVGLSGRF